MTCKKMRGTNCVTKFNMRYVSDVKTWKTNTSEANVDINSQP